MLYFFLGENESRDDIEVRVMQFNGDSKDLVRASQPDIALRCEYANYFDSPHMLTLVPALSLAPYGHPDIDRTLRDDKMWDTFTAFVQTWEERHRFVHGLLTYGSVGCDDPRDEAAAKYTDTRPQDWLTLAQFGFDKKTGFCFWDAGTLSFLLHKDHLAAMDFSRVYASLLSF